MDKVDAQVYACWTARYRGPARSGARPHFRPLQKFAGKVKNSSLNAAMLLPGLDSISSQ
jgi:hypothetical protein